VVVVNAKFIWELRLFKCNEKRKRKRKKEKGTTNGVSKHPNQQVFTQLKCHAMTLT